MEQTEQNKDKPRHYGGYGKPLQTVVGYDAVDYYYESSCGTAYLDGATSKCRNEEAAYDSCDETDCRADATGYTESYSQRQSYDADYYTGNQVGFET